MSAEALYTIAILSLLFNIVCAYNNLRTAIKNKKVSSTTNIILGRPEYRSDNVRWPHPFAPLPPSGPSGVTPSGSRVPGSGKTITR